MASIRKKPLSKIKRDIRNLLRELDKQIDTYLSAGQTASHIESSISIAQAYQGMAMAMAKAQRIKQNIMEIAGELNRRLEAWDNALKHLENDPKGIKEAYFAVRSYEEGRRIAKEEQSQLRGILNTISAALTHAQQTMSGFSVSSGKTSYLDKIVAGTNTDSKYKSRNNYVSLAVTYATIPSLDAERYGKANYSPATEYINPNLNPSGNQRRGSLSDKIRLGGDYTQRGNYANYTVKLSNHLNQILRAGYSSKYGVYSTPA